MRQKYAEEIMHMSGVKTSKKKCDFKFLLQFLKYF